MTAAMTSIPLAAANDSANDSYDNPAMNGTPCVILQSYQTSNGDGSFGAVATLENVCARSVELSFCLPLVASADGAEPHCRHGLLRPWATSRIEASGLPGKPAGPDYHWRWRHTVAADR